MLTNLALTVEAYTPHMPLGWIHSTWRFYLYGGEKAFPIFFLYCNVLIRFCLFKQGEKGLFLSEIHIFCLTYLEMLTAETIWT